jgi:hypothetical protein
VVVFWQAKECCAVENDAYVPLLVFIEGNEDKNFEDRERSMGGGVCVSSVD